MLERLILLVNLVEYILQVHFFGFKFRNRVSIRYAINSLIKYKISVATSFVNPILLFILVVVINIFIVDISSSIRVSLSTKAFFFQVLNVEMLNCCIIKLKPFTVVLRIWISFFNVTVIVPSIS